MKKITSKKSSSFLSYINTPWNEKSLGLKSNEIIDADYNYDFDIVLESFEQECLKEKIDLSVFRTVNKNLITHLEKRGYAKTEISLEVFKSFRKVNKFVTKNKIDILKKAKHFNKEIKEFAYQDFHFGRFQEDYRISEEKSRKRNELWIDDLNEDASSHCLVGLCKGNFVGFMYYKIIDDHVNLILGGVKNNFAHLVQEFWKEVINQLILHRSISTVISAANPQIINLYSNLGFTFKKSLIGLHKHRSI